MKKKKDKLERIEFKTKATLKEKFKSKCTKNNKSMTEVLEEKMLEYLLEEENKK